MSAISASVFAIYGIQANLRRLDDAANRIAGQPSDSDLAADLVDLKTAKNVISANAKVIKTADELLGTLLDTFA